MVGLVWITLCQIGLPQLFEFYYAFNSKKKIKILYFWSQYETIYTSFFIIIHLHFRNWLHCEHAGNLATKSKKHFYMHTVLSIFFYRKKKNIFFPSNLRKYSRMFCLEMLTWKFTLVKGLSVFNFFASLSRLFYLRRQVMECF